MILSGIRCLKNYRGLRGRRPSKKPLAVSGGTAASLSEEEIDACNQSESRRGAALISALWLLIILSLLISSFAFDMHIEAGITTYARKRTKAEYLALAGVEWARAAVSKSFRINPDELEDDDVFTAAPVNLSRGVGIRGRKQELGDGFFTVDILPEKGRLNVNKLTDREWEELLDQSGVPEDRWPELIDCFHDWVDKGDEHHLNGAESDDPFYEDRGYECKNAELDTVDELLLIKGFTRSIVYGGPSDIEGERYRGIARHLTAWGDGKLNVNTADRDALLIKLVDADEWLIDEILEFRKGLDGVAGTEDDGLESLSEVPGLEQFSKQLTTKDIKHVRVISIGEVGGVKSGVWCILEAGEEEMKTLYWREEIMP